MLLLAAPAFVAIWSGWVGLGGLTGFGVIHPLPGIWNGLSLNTAITLPIGVETYAAYALRVWLSGEVPVRARRFARWSAIGSLLLGAAGQVAYHLLVAAGVTSAPWQITTLVACLPVAVLGMGAALTHLLRAPLDGPVEPEPVDEDLETLAAALAVQDALAAALAPLGDDSVSPDDQPEVARPRRAKRQPSNAERVTRAVRRTPTATAAQIAARLELSERTVTRYWPADVDDTTRTPEPPAHVNGHAPELAEVAS